MTARIQVGLFSCYSCLVVKSYLNLCNPMDCSMPSSCHSLLLKFISVETVMLSNHLILCHPLLLLPSVFPSIRVFSNESAPHIRWPKFGASASVLPMNTQGWFPLGLTGLISLQSKGLLRVFSNTTTESINSLALSLLCGLSLTWCNSCSNS